LIASQTSGSRLCAA